MKQRKSNINFPAILFHEGMNYRSYEYFGVHRMLGKYSFRVWIPDALEVYLVLYFDDSVKEHPMKKITDRGIWELFIYTMPLQNAEYIYEDLENVCYRYRIVTKEGEFIRNDPFSFMLSKEENCTLISTKGTFLFNDQYWEISRAKVILCGGAYPFYLNVLCVDIQSLAKKMGLDHPDYRLITKKLLPFVKKMKYSHVKLSLVNQCVQTSKGDLYPMSLYSPYSYVGAIDDFKYLVNRFHNAEIGVIIDFAPSFYADLKFGLSSFAGTNLYEYSDIERAKSSGDEIGCFDLARKENLSYLISAAFYWLEEFHVDAVNVKYADSFFDLNYGREPERWIHNRYRGTENLEGIHFLQQLNSAVAKELPDRFVMTEQSEYLYKGITSRSDINVGFKFGVNNKWISEFSECLGSFQKERFLSFLSDSCILPALYSDVTQSKESLINKMLRSGDVFAVLRTIKVIQMTLPGKKLEILGDEQGKTTIQDYIKRIGSSTEIDAALCRHLCFVQNINFLYFMEKSFYENDLFGNGFTLIDFQHDDVIAYKRTSQHEKEYIVAVNLSTEFVEGIVLPAKAETDYYKTVLNSNEKRFGGTGGTILGRYRVRKKTWDFEVDLPPLSAVILTPVIRKI